MNSYYLVAPFSFLMFITSIAYGSNNTETEDAVTEAWQKYKVGEYSAARKIVDKYYDKSHVYLSLLSGMLYAKDNKCKDALKAIEYVEGYYDEHRDDITNKPTDNKSGILNAYLNYKKIGMKCHFEMKNWVEFISDATAYLDLSKEDDVHDILAMLGMAYKKSAISSIQNSIAIYSRIVSGAASHDLKEDAYFHLTHLYSMEGQTSKAIYNAEKLLKKSNNKEKWVSEMKKLPELSLVLQHNKIKVFLDK